MQPRCWRNCRCGPTRPPRRAGARAHSGAVRTARHQASRRPAPHRILYRAWTSAAAASTKRGSSRCGNCKPLSPWPAARGPRCRLARCRPPALLRRASSYPSGTGAPPVASTYCPPAGGSADAAARAAAATGVNAAAGFRLAPTCRIRGCRHIASEDLPAPVRAVVEDNRMLRARQPAPCSTLPVAAACAPVWRWPACQPNAKPPPRPRARPPATGGAESRAEASGGY